MNKKNFNKITLTVAIVSIIAGISIIGVVSFKSTFTAKKPEIKSNTTTGQLSLAEKYSEMARNVRIEPEGTTVSGYSDKDIDDPVLNGNLVKHKIISEELKITQRNKTTINDTDKKWLTCVVFHETASEPYEGKLACANVILNMYYDNSGVFKDTITGIVFQEGVFAATKADTWNPTVALYDSGEFTTENHLLCIKAVDDALNGKNNIGTRLHFNFYYMEKDKNHKNAVRIQNELYW